MANKTYHRPVGFTETVSSDQAGSGSMRIEVFSNPPYGGTDDWAFNLTVRDSANKIKTNGINATYNTVSGTLILEDGDTSLVQNDKVTVFGMFVAT